MSDLLPLLAGFGPGDPLLWHAGNARPTTAAQFCGAAAALARALPRACYAINRCEDPGRFVLGGAAALLAGQTLVLPQARGADAQAQLRSRYPDAYTLADTREAGDTVAVPALADAAVGTCWPPPAIDPGHVAAILFTSGSTGIPAAHAKSWSSLVRGAGTFVGSFGPLPRNAIVVGTVAPQHMFGFETTVMLPWQAGVALYGARPLYPGDLAMVANALAARNRAAWLMTTPLHLRAFHAGLRTPPRIAQVIASTMPLSRELAHAVENEWGVAVREVYGCTEGGMLATRRPARDVRFAAGAGLSCRLDAEGRATFAGGQLDAPLPVPDRFRDAEGALELIGRSQEIVKVAGKRTTLAALTAALQSIPGVRDGAFLLPESDAARVAALVVAPAHDAVSLRRALAARIDRAFLPRPLAFVAALPRDAQGKLARADAHALLESAASGAASRPDRVLVRECSVAADHPSLPGHFPGHPIVPGAVLLERIERLLRDHGMAIAAVNDARFRRPVAPGEPLRLCVELDDASRARFRIDTGGASAVSGTLRWNLRP
jgi:acyl-coenzyme A synthetase/AMP-(fatty) acid ligase